MINIIRRLLKKRETVVVDGTLGSIFTEVKKLRLEKDDVLVFRCKSWLDMEHKTRVMSALELATGHPRCIVLDGGCDLAVLTSKPQDEIVQAPVQRPDAVARHRPLSAG